MDPQKYFEDHPASVNSFENHWPNLKGSYKN